MLFEYAFFVGSYTPADESFLRKQQAELEQIGFIVEPVEVYLHGDLQ